MRSAKEKRIAHVHFNSSLTFVGVCYFVVQASIGS